MRKEKISRERTLKLCRLKRQTWNFSMGGNSSLAVFSSWTKEFIFFSTSSRNFCVSTLVFSSIWQEFQNAKYILLLKLQSNYHVCNYLFLHLPHLLALVLFLLTQPRRRRHRAHDRSQQVHDGYLDGDQPLVHCQLLIKILKSKLSENPKFIRLMFCDQLITWGVGARKAGARLLGTSATNTGLPDKSTRAGSITQNW